MDAPAAYQISWTAMGTEWRLQIVAERSEMILRSIAEAVMEEIERVEQQLSFYRETSDVRNLNQSASLEWTPVDPELFHLLDRVQQFSQATDGAFDPTIGPLLRCWGFVGASGKMPTEREVEETRSIVGIQHVILDADTMSVRFDREGIELEFGAVGKGYAIDRAVEMLRDEYEIENALIHGGTSTIYGMGAPPGAFAWNVAIQRPNCEEGESLLTVPLCNRAVSVSAPHNKAFEQGGRQYGHVLDPRSGCPTAGNAIAVVATDSAAASDALSTALLVLGEAGIAVVRKLQPDAFTLLGANQADGSLKITREGPLLHEGE